MTRTLTTIATLAAAAGLARAQASAPTAFVANNGNLEGSVTTYTLDAAGTPSFVAEFVIGARNSGEPDIPTTNAYAIDITPDGRFLAVTHATSFANERVTILEVNSDGTLSEAGVGTGIGTSLDCAWVTNDILALVRSSFGGINGIETYRFNEAAGTLTQLDFLQIGSFLSNIDLHPNGTWILAGDGSGNTIFNASVNPATGELALIDAYPTIAYALDVTVTNAGSRVYATGGISAGRNTIYGLSIDANGFLFDLPGGPWLTPGNSPKDIAFNSDDTIAYVAHGTDATVRSFAVGIEGDLTYTGNTFDVGFQGSHGQTEVLDLGSKEVVLFTDDDDIFDNIEGLYSFDVNPAGDFANQNGTPIPSGGTWAEHLTVWAGDTTTCPADLSSPASPGIPDGILSGADFFEFLVRFEIGDLSVDFSSPANPGQPDGLLSGADFFEFLSLFAAGC